MAYLKKSFSSLSLPEILEFVSDIFCEDLVEFLEVKLIKICCCPPLPPTLWLTALDFLILRLTSTESLAVCHLQFRFSYAVAGSAEDSANKFDSLYWPTCLYNFWGSLLPFTSLMDLRRVTELLVCSAVYLLWGWSDDF